MKVAPAEAAEAVEDQLLNPRESNLTAPANNKVCETGTSISDTQSNVDFSWSASANTSTYDLKIINLEGNTVINKNGLTTTILLLL